jgi:beta-lactamase class D
MKKPNIIFCFVFPIFLSTSFLHAQKPGFTEFLDLDSIFAGNSGSFELLHQNKNTFYIYQVENANITYPVYSTSKIVWSAIVLESGVVKSASEKMKWDSLKYPPEEWWPESWKQDQTIVSALHNSVNWYYAELLQKIDPEIVHEYLLRFNYISNYDIITNSYYALAGTIKMSAFDQINFLWRIQSNNLAVSAKTLDIIKQGMLLEKTGDYTFYFRTGLGPVNDEENVGWYIGYIEKGEDVYFFALNVLHEDVWEAGKLRDDYIRRILKSLDII